MPELPDIVVYVERLNDLYAGKEVQKLDLRSPFVLRTFKPDIFLVEGQKVVEFQRQAKRIVWKLSEGMCLVFHLMITGRFHQRKPGTKPKSKSDLAAFHFEDSTLMLTEAGKQHRAAIYCYTNFEEIEE